MNIISFFKELLQRLQLESPSFYKKLQWGAVFLVALLGVVIAGNEMFDWGLESVIFLKMPLTSIINILIGFISGVFTFSLTPVKNPHELK